MHSPEAPQVNPEIGVSPPEVLKSPEAFIRAHTFAEAEALPRIIKDSTIEGIIGDTLKDDVGDTVFNVKHWLDRSEPSDTEIQISHDPELVAKLHDETVDLITDNLRIATHGLDDRTKGYIAGQRDSYLARLESDKQVFRTVAEESRSGEKRTTRLNGAAEFIGFNVDTARGRQNLMDVETKVPGARPNIRVQSDVGGTFIHWHTDERVKKSVNSEPTAELTKRIYLNPEVTEIAGTFETIMKALNAAGIDAKGKMFVKANEAMSTNAGDKVESVRADSIVLALSDKDADSVLDLVLSLYKDNPKIFEDRDTPKIPVKIAPGIAVGEEPGEEGQSLTTSRAEILDSAGREVRQELGIKSGDPVPPIAIDKFRAKFSEKARAAGISEQNLAFAA